MAVKKSVQSALVFGSGSSVPDGDQRGEDGLTDGSVKVHHHHLCQVEYLLQEVHLTCWDSAFATCRMSLIKYLLCTLEIK